MSRPPFFVCALSLHSSGGAFLEKEKRMRECVKREQEFHFAAILPEIMFPLHLSDLPVPPFVFAFIMPPVYSCSVVAWELEEGE